MVKLIYILYLLVPMDIKDRIKGAYYGWFFGPGALLRKELSDNYQNIQNNPKYAQVKRFEDIPSDHKMYDQLTQTLIVHNIIVEHGTISPELFKDKLLELNEKDDILHNDQYGPSTQKAVKLLLEGADPKETGKAGLTVGGAMRCIPVGVYFHNDKDKMIKNTYESCIISHNTDVAVSSALAVNTMLSSLLYGNNSEESLRSTLKVVQENYGKYGEPTATAYIHERIRDAVSWIKNKSFDEATGIIAQKVGSSWYSIEGIPAGFAIYKATKDAKDACLMAFHIGYTHTAPQIACAFHGAEKGPEIFPEDIIKKIEKVNNFNIDKLVEEIIAKI